MTDNCKCKSVDQHVIRDNTIKDILNILHVKREIWFHQSLTAGSATFWNHKVQTTQQLMNEIEEYRCQLIKTD